MTEYVWSFCGSVITWSPPITDNTVLYVHKLKSNQQKKAYN